LGLVEACLVLEEINASGGNAAVCHAQMYTMGALLRHGSDAQKRRYLPEIAAGRLRLQSMAVTEPEAGSDTARITTFARRDANGYVIDGQNAERILIASQSVGDARWFVDRCVAYAGDRVAFGRPIGANQGVQFPIARAFMHARAAALLRWQAAALFDAGKACGAEANMAKLLASEAAWEAADVAMTTFGGSGMAVEVGIERKFREARLYLVAPVK